MVEGGIPFPMLTDPAGQIGSAYQVYDPQKHVDLRGTFIIDPNGNIQSMEVLSAGVGRNIKEILRQLIALQHNTAESRRSERS